MDKPQITADFNDIEGALTRALTYPRKSIMGEIGYNNAHADLQDALTKLGRLKRAVYGSLVGTNLEKGNR